MSERTVTVRLRALISDYQKAMQTAAGEAKTFAATVKGNFTQLNQDVGRLGDTMTRRVTLPLVGVGVGAVKLAGDFESTFGQMVGLAGVAGDEVDGLREAVLKLSKDTARGPNELAQALYFIRSSGIDAAHAMGVLEVAAKASAAGLGSTVVVADAVTSAMNAYGAANLSAQQATDILTAAVREGKTEAAALAPQLGILIPTAAAMGISFAQVAGVMAVMSRTGLDAAEASTSLNAIFSTLLGTSKEGVAALETHGLSLQKLRDIAAGPGGLVAVMRLLDGAFKGNDEALSVIIPNVRAFRGVMNVLAQDAGSVDTVMRNVANSTGATNDAFAAMKATEAFKTRDAIIELQIALLRLGAALQPIVSQFVGGIAVIASAFSTLPHWLQETVVWLGLVAVAAGPAMKAFSLVSSVAVPAMQVAIRAVQGLQVQLALARMEGLTTGQALRQMATGATPYIVAATVVIGAAAMAIHNHNQVAKEARQRGLEWAQAIQADNEALANNTGIVNENRIAILKRAIAEADLNDNLTKAGITYQQFEDALLGTNGANREAIGLLIQKGQLTGHELLGLQKILDAMAAGTREANENAAAGINSADALKVQSEAAFDSANAQLAAALAASDQANALNSLAAEATIAENALRGLLSALNSTYASAFAVTDAQQAFADSLADVDSAARAGGGSSRDLTGQQRSLEKATKDVTKAQEDLAKAEADLAKARQGPSARDKSDAGLNVREAQLGVKEAIRAQADARKRLLDERKKGKEGDVAGAQLDLERSAISLKRAQDRLTDAQADQNKVMHSGEETSDNVKSALDDLKAAQERVTDATQAQIDAETQLRGESGGGPVADRARSIRGSYDQMVNSAKDWIGKLIEQKRPTSEVITALDNQSASAQKLIDVYGDPDGKLARFIEANERLRLIFTDPKFISNFTAVAAAIGGMLGVDIPNFFGSDSTGGRAHGGPVGAGATVRINEQGDEYLTMGNKPGYVSTAAQMSSLYSSPMMSAASMGGPMSLGELTVHVEVEGDTVKVANHLVRLSKQNGGLPIRIRSGN